MFDQGNRGKIKDAKILVGDLSWVTWLMTFATNLAAKTSRRMRPPVFVFCLLSLLCKISISLWVTLVMRDFITLCRSVIYFAQFLWRDEESRNCRTCAEVKPFFRPPLQTLVEAVRPLDRISFDFKWPDIGPRPYLLIVIDEYSSLPFVFPWKLRAHPLLSNSVCLFCILCFLSFVHSNQDTSFVSLETRAFLVERWIAFSTPAPFHPKGNSHCERANQTVFAIKQQRTVKLLLHDKNLPADWWKMVLPEALHAVRSLVCLATLFLFRFWTFVSVFQKGDEWIFTSLVATISKTCSAATSLPSWIVTPGPVLRTRPELQCAFRTVGKVPSLSRILRRSQNLLSGLLILRRAEFLTMYIPPDRCGDSIV